MYLFLFLLFGLVNCKLYLIETKNHKHQKIKSSTSSPTETGTDYMDSYEEEEQTKPKTNDKTNTSAHKGQDYGWLNKCSFKTPCSEESCMVQKDIPGCGGSIDLLCTGGCLTIHKVAPPSSGCGWGLKNVLVSSCPGALHLQDQGLHTRAKHRAVRCCQKAV